MRAAIALVMSVIGCQLAPTTGGDEQAIVMGGASDRDPAVVAITWAGVARCSGTVVTSRLVLTAAHCLRTELPQVMVGPDAAHPDQVVAVLGQIFHPRYGDLGSRDDVALLVLAEPLSVTRPRWPVPGDSPLVGDRLRVVGFGRTDPEVAGDRVRRAGTVAVSTVEGPVVLATAAPSQVCFGDSGGPALAATTEGEVLVGVISDVGIGCEGEAVLVRVDQLVTDFLQPWATRLSDYGSTAGERCWFDAQCEAGGRCLATSDAPDLRFCANSCSMDATCEAPLTCEAGWCRHPSPSPGATGSACAHDRDCVDGACLAVGEDGAWQCSQRCAPGRNDCGDGLECRATSGGGDYGCVARAPAGCAIGGSTDGDGLAALPLLWACLGRIRRRRRPRDLAGPR